MWKNPECSGDIPSPRYEASTAIIENKLWLYGGRAPFLHHQSMYELNMLSLSWTRIETTQKPTNGYCSSTLTPITGSHLVLRDMTSTWIYGADSCTWRQLPSSLNDRHGRFRHSGITSLQRNVIIIGGQTTISPPCILVHEDDDDNYTPFFCVMLEPKSLQQVAMTTIYKNRTELAWKILPPQLIRKIMGPESVIL